MTLSQILMLLELMEIFLCLQPGQGTPFQNWAMELVSDCVIQLQQNKNILK